MSGNQRSTQTVGEAVKTSLQASVGAIVELEPAVISGGDPEDLHRYRVALRRLRSDLRTLAPVLDMSWNGSLDQAIRGVAADVGVVREADVLSDRLEGRLDELRAVDQVAGRRLMGHLDNQLADATSRLLTRLAGDEHAGFMATLQAAVQDPVFASGSRRSYGPSEPAAPVMASLVRRQWRRLSRAVDALRDPVTDQQLHRIRILAKRVRYAADLATCAWGRDTRGLSVAMAEVQQVLGDLQDSVQAEQWLRDAAEAVPVAATCAGMLIALEWPIQTANRAAFDGVWARASRRELRSWCRKNR